jgi:hypothetical protein
MVIRRKSIAKPHEHNGSVPMLIGNSTIQDLQISPTSKQKNAAAKKG